MEPVGLLMREHRLIERIIFVMRDEIDSINKTKTIDKGKFFTIIDFIASYVDRTHHGKEEDILFKAILKKNISKEHRDMVDELVKEHGISRMTTRELKNQIDKYKKSSDQKYILGEVTKNIEILIELYPRHIEKEDKEFFLPVLNYFTVPERQEMINKFYDFDRIVIHKKYEEVIESLEKK